MEKYNELVKYTNRYSEPFRGNDSIIEYEFNWSETYTANRGENEILGAYSDKYILLVHLYNITADYEYLEWFEYDMIYS